MTANAKVKNDIRAKLWSFKLSPGDLDKLREVAEYHKLSCAEYLRQRIAFDHKRMMDKRTGAG